MPLLRNYDKWKSLYSCCQETCLAILLPISWLDKLQKSIKKIVKAWSATCLKTVRSYWISDVPLGDWFVFEQFTEGRTVYLISNSNYFTLTMWNWQSKVLSFEGSLDLACKYLSSEVGFQICKDYDCICFILATHLLSFRRSLDISNAMRPFLTSSNFMVAVSNMSTSIISKTTGLPYL